MSAAEKDVQEPQTKDVPKKLEDEFDAKLRPWHLLQWLWAWRRRRRLVSSLEGIEDTIPEKINDRNLSENIKLCDDVSLIPNKPEEFEPTLMEIPNSKRFCKMKDDKDDKDNIYEELRNKVDEEDDEKMEKLKLIEELKADIEEHKRLPVIDLDCMEIKRSETLEKEEHESAEITWFQESKFFDPWLVTDHKLIEEEHNDMENEEHKEETFAYVLWRLFGCENAAEYEMRSYSACFPNDDLKKNKDKLPKDEYIALVRSGVEEIFKPLIEDANAFECVYFMVVDGTINQFIMFLYEIEMGNDKELTMELNKIINYVSGLRMMLDEKRLIDSITSRQSTDEGQNLPAPPSSQFRRMRKTKDELLTQPMQEAIEFLDLLDSKSSSPPCAAAPITSFPDCNTVDCSFDFYY